MTEKKYSDHMEDKLKEMGDGILDLIDGRLSKHDDPEDEEKEEEE